MAKAKTVAQKAADKKAADKKAADKKAADKKAADKKPTKAERELALIKKHTETLPNGVERCSLIYANGVLCERGTNKPVKV